MITKDSFGIIGQIQADGSIEGGDSVNWTGHYVYLTNNPFPFVETFQVGFGAYVRHPMPLSTNNGFGAFYKNPWNGCISRDQLTGVLAALIKKGNRVDLLKALAHHICSGLLFAYNNINNGDNPTKHKWKIPDLTLFNIWALYLRGFGRLSWAFWPLLCILDLQDLLIIALVNDKKGDNDVISYTIRYIISREHIPTPTSYISSKILNKTTLLTKLRSYWCTWRNNCGMYDLYLNKLNR